MIRLTERQLRKTVRHILKEVEIGPLPIDILSIEMPEEEEEEVVWDMMLPVEEEPLNAVDLNELTPEEAFGLAMDPEFDSYPEDHVDVGGRMFDYGSQKSDSHEGRMSKAKLHRMGNMAQSLHDRLEDGDDLPGWVQDKITTAEDRLQSAYDYMDYKIHRLESKGFSCNESAIRKITRKYFKSNL